MADLPTPRLSLPLLQPGQTQKEMSHNEALTLLDIAVQGNVTEIDAGTPPVAPEPGQCWVLGATPSGAWAGHAGEVACWTAAGWRFLLPREGMRLWIGAVQGFALFSGGEWRSGEAHGKLFIEGLQVVGPRVNAVAEPIGGTTVDAEARAAIVAVLEALRLHGLVETT